MSKIKKITNLYELFGTFNLINPYPRIELDKEWILSDKEIKSIENRFDVELENKYLKKYNKYTGKTNNVYIFVHKNRMSKIISKCKIYIVNDEEIYSQIAKNIKLTDYDKIYLQDIGVNIKDYYNELPF